MKSWQAILGPDPPDEWLMRLVASNQAESLDAFETLVERHEGRLLSYFARATGNAHHAEELAAETLFSLFRGRGNYNPDRTLRPYLYGIARRCLIDWFDRMKTTPRTIGLEAADPARMVDGTSSSPGESADAAERRNEIRQKVMSLPEPFREAVTLCYFDGLKPSEAADVLDVPSATVRTRLARGLALLRLRLGSQ
jgi:RNA polymerase sigma-70 factor (ECF subfamily)